jgi:hypothetical protein
MTAALTFLAAGLAVMAEGRYIVSILRKKTKPSFAGWLLFSISMVCVFVSSYILGARDSLFLVGTFAILNTVVAVLALKYGFMKFTEMDVALYILALFGIMLWWQTSTPWYTLIVSTLIDTFGYIIMARKLYIHPGTEDRWSWAMSVAAYGLNLVLISHWVPEEYLFSVSNVVWCGITLVLALRPVRAKAVA